MDPNDRSEQADRRSYNFRSSKKRVAEEDFAITPYDEDQDDLIYHQPNFLFTKNIHSLLF
jgi:hypothetical protein